MIDPTLFPRYNLSVPELEEVLLFTIAVAGKNAMTTAKALERFLRNAGWKGQPHSPLEVVRWLTIAGQVSHSLKRAGIGCQTMKGRAFTQVALADLDLQTCTVEDLEKIHGIGPKTARFFILHTRKDAEVACLDTHILKYLNKLGHTTPTSTPRGKYYLELETVFLAKARELKKSPAELDIEIWREYSGH